jgi:hypothetical protein
MPDELTQARTKDIATLALKAKSIGVADGWREYLADEMKKTDISGREVAAEMDRQAGIKHAET